jgi:SAM-dependent methyltransferase
MTRPMAVGWDPKRESVRQWDAERLAHEGTASRLARADAEALPFRDGCLDGVYAFGVLHHTPRIETAIAEIWRGLKPGGVAVVGLYHRWSLFYWWWLLFRGLLRGELFRDGYRVVMSQVERRLGGLSWYILVTAHR